MTIFAKTDFRDKSLTSFETPNGVMTLSKIFIPFLMETLLLNTMGTINTLMLSHYSDEAVAAVGAASQLIGMVTTLYTVIGNGASIVINHNLGGNRKKAASDAAFTSIIFCGSFSLVFGTLLSLLARPVMGLMHLEPHVQAEAVGYFQTIIRFSFLQALISSISGIFRSYGHPKITVCVSLSMNGLMLLLDYLIVFRPVEFPLYGVSGIAVGYVISEAFALLLLLLFLWKVQLGLDFSHKSIRTLSMITKILRIGIPSGISNISYSLSQVVSTSIIAVLGTAAISTKVYVSNIVFYVYMVGMSLGLSTSLFVGWMCGAQEYDRAYRLNLRNLKVTIALNLTLSTLLFLFAKPVLSLFTSDPEILSMGRTLLLIDILVELGRGFNHIEENSLRGAGDVYYPMAVSMLSCWTMSIFFSWLFGIRLGFGLPGCWFAFAMDELFRGAAYLTRWRSKKWAHKAV